MEQLLDALRAAMHTETISIVLDTLVEIAVEFVGAGNKDRAADILALVLHYPLNRYSRETAEALFSDLEAELCPRVIYDAKARAEELTLEDMVAEVLSSEQE